jgi:hypothetical protein
MSRPCEGKHRYPSGAAARQALASTKRRGAKGEQGKPTREYPCPFCHGFHLTSQDFKDSGKRYRNDRKMGRKKRDE